MNTQDGAADTFATAESGDDLRVAFDIMAQRIAGTGTAPIPVVPEVKWIADLFQLDRFGYEILVLGAYSALEPQAADTIAGRQGDGQFYPTVALALSALSDPHWWAVTPEAPLRRHRLIELSDNAPLAARRLAIDDAVLTAIVGAVAFSDASLAVLRDPAGAPDDQAWPSVLLDRALTGQDTRVQLGGSALAGAAATEAAAWRTGLRPVYLDAAALPGPAEDMARLAAVLGRDLALNSGLLIVEPTAENERAAVLRLLDRIGGRVVILDDHPAYRRHGRTAVLDGFQADPAQQFAAWRDGATDAGDRAFAQRLSHQFTLGGAQLAALRARHRDRMAQLDRAAAERATWDDARRQVRARIDGLAQRIEPQAGWPDLMVADRTTRALKSIASQVRHKSLLEGEWGFKSGAFSRGSGLAAMFAGPSGTGKTLAAEVLAGDLHLDLFRIDLSAVMSKWIGETEKHLRQLFDAAEESAAILLFDEADALFGKRSDVRDSHDRYANVEVSYLLQRLETYRGLAILTTNLKRNIDDAFLRRLRFIVDFPFPEVEERRAIWARAFPADCPTETLDFDRLARLSATGGAIRNMALNAAAFAAARGCHAVTMRDIREAAELEREKAGHSLTPAERAGW